MKIYTKVVYQMNDDGTMTELESDSYDYDGPVAKCFGGDGGRTTTQTTSTQDIDTTSVGIESVEGIGIASAGDVNFNQEITQTDQGAVAASFEFADEIGDSAFDFAGDIARGAAETSQRAIETSQRAIATVATGGGSDVAGINQKTIVAVMAGLAAIFIIPAIIRGRA